MPRSLLQSHMQRFLRPTMEQVSTDGVEREYVFFGKLVDPAELLKAEYYEDQEQWSVDLVLHAKFKQGSMRIRRVMKVRQNDDGSKDEIQGPTYFLTYKLWDKDDPSAKIEVEEEIAESKGKVLLDFLRAQGFGMIKRRYVFPAHYGRAKEAGGPWEVDVYYVKPLELTEEERIAGNVPMHPWVKLDLEVKAYDWKLSKDSFEVPFPVTLSDVVYTQPKDRSKDEQKVIDRILRECMDATTC